MKSCKILCCLSLTNLWAEKVEVGGRNEKLVVFSSMIVRRLPNDMIRLHDSQVYNYTRLHRIVVSLWIRFGRVEYAHNRKTLSAMSESCFSEERF